MARDARKQGVRQRGPRPPRAARMEDKVPHDFVMLMHNHLRALGKGSQWLAGEMGVSGSIVSQWLTARDRYVSRGQVSRLAFVLAREYQAQRGERSDDAPGPTESEMRREDRDIPRYKGVRDLEAILNELLRSLGYRSMIGERNLVWHRLAGESDRVLRVGWSEYYPLTYAHAGDLSRAPLGIASMVTEKVAALMGVRVEWHHYDVTEITPALLRNRIDMICCQYIRIDPRFFDVWVSDPLPFLRVKPALLVHGEHVHRIRRDAGAGYGALDYSKMIVLHTDTSIGRCLANFLTPPAGQAGLADVLREIIPKPGTRDDDQTALRMPLAKACEDVLTNPVDRRLNRVRCLATDSLTAWTAALESQGQSLPGRSARWALGPAAVVDIPGVRLPLFSVGFGLHPEDADMFGRMLNRGIENLRQLYFFGNPGKFGPERAGELNAAATRPRIDPRTRTDLEEYFGPAYVDYVSMLLLADALPTERFSQIREMTGALDLFARDLWGDPNKVNA